MAEKGQEENEGASWFSYFFENSKDKGTSVVTSNVQSQINKINEKIAELKRDCTEEKNVCELGIIENLWKDVQPMQNHQVVTNTKKNALKENISSYELKFSKCGTEVEQ